ncbi:M24 family metallopeptidase [Ferviditalea candida]|uniref:Xaa-Pro peptidase family protein n=1 Tax=Ferviditalea candida TaxID=3108399 RepID=A0ABU5ZG43_9BACL|nr:Xaa-Pro peptidase family protein [Paenibacillaceae bacterium T2]
MESVRIQRLRNAMAKIGLEALLITNVYNRRYMTGFTGTAGYALITQEKAVLYTDFRYRTQAPLQAKYYEVIEHLPNLTDSIKMTLNELQLARLGFEQDHLRFGTYQEYAKKLAGIELVPTSNLVETLRLEKDDSELQVLREAAELADRTFSHILKVLRPGLAEKDIALEIEIFLRRNGADSSSFDTIVASGERSALPHGVAGERKLGSNEFVKLDFGAYYKGYCSDITRTVLLGKPSDKHRQIYDIVLEAQLNVLEHLKPGMIGREADALARGVIAKYGYGDHFGHGTGHGLGLEIHEAPRLSVNSDTVLKPGMVVTVEPGIYLPGFGGVRIEDDVVITHNGIEIITKASKDFIVLN